MSEEDAEARAHHTKNGFCNPYLKDFHKSLPDVLKMRWTSNWAHHHALSHEVPQRPVDLDKIHCSEARSQLTWIGHSTFLIQHKGKNILTDPVFAERASPLSFAGPKRYTPPALLVRDLPRIDYVLISHNHYDHMDLKSIAAIGNHPIWLMPLGNAAPLKKIGITNVRELDWWERAVCARTNRHTGNVRRPPVRENFQCGPSTR